MLYQWGIEAPKGLSDLKGIWRRTSLEPRCKSISGRRHDLPLSPSLKTLSGTNRRQPQRRIAAASPAACTPSSSVCPQLLCVPQKAPTAHSSSRCLQLLYARRLVGCREPLGPWPGRHLCLLLLCSAVPCPVQGHTGPDPQGSSSAGAKVRKATVLLPVVGSGEQPRRCQGASAKVSVILCVPSLLLAPELS